MTVTAGIAPSLYNTLTAGFNKLSQQADKDGLATYRKEAFSFFAQNGFPTIKQEDWRFTNIASFLNEEFVVNTNTIIAEVSAENVVNTAIPGLDAYRLVLVNGSINFDLSVLPQDAGFTLQPLASIRHTDLFVQRLSRKESTGAQSMVALNTALFTDGFFIEVSVGTIIDKPIEVLNFYTAVGNTFFQPRNLVVVNKLAQIVLVEKNIVLKENAVSFVNSVTDVEVKENAHYTHYQLQHNGANERWIHTQLATQAPTSTYNHFTYIFPESELIRNSVDIRLEGSGTETHIYALYLAGKEQLIDNHTAIHHIHPHCESNQHYKGVVMDKARAVFNGKVFVEREAQKTNAYQQNNNILLGEKAQLYAKPQLEIFADDVKCSHGCTTGQFDPAHLFYLQARGISKDTAKKMLVEAFAYDITEKIEIEAVKEYVQQLIFEKLENQ